MTRTAADLPPDSAVAGDVFVDTYDENKIFVAVADYTITDSAASLVIQGESRATGSDLTFTAITPGFAGTCITVEIERAGASGTSTKSRTGAGTRDNPYAYVFSLYDNDNTNAAVIALLSGDPYLTATGDDAESPLGSVEAVAETHLVLDEAANWALRQIKVQYDAEHPGVFGTSDAMPSAFPLPMLNALPEYLAARLSNMNNGGDLAKARNWFAMWQEAVSKSRTNQHSNAYPRTMRPG